MPLPWEDEKEEPANLPANSVSFTAWVKCSFKPALGERLKCRFKWFTSDGEMSEQVDAGAIGSWDRTRVEPGTVPGPDGEPPEPRMIHSVFEKKSEKIKASCAFCRSMPGLRLVMSVQYSGGEEGDEDGAQDIEKDIVLPLAPLMMMREDDEHAQLEVTEEKGLAGSEIPGLSVFVVGVRCSTAVLSNDIADYLNPVLVSVDGVRSLPKEPHLGQNSCAFARMSGLGRKEQTELVPIDEKGKAAFNFHSAFFVGPWRQHELREYMHTEKIMIEVHDRDPPEEVVDEDDGVEKEQERKRSRSRGRTSSKEDYRKVHPHGIARIPLAELLNPAISRPINIRAQVEPAARNKRQRGKGAGGATMTAASLFGEGAQDLLSSITARRQEHAPGFLDSGTYVSVTLTIARPIKSASVIQNQLADDVGTKKKKKKSPSRGNSKVSIATANESESFECYGRVVFVFDYRKTTVVKRLLSMVNEINTRSVGLDAGGGRSLATQKLTAEQKEDRTLDILTGFIVMDRSMRVIVIEGLRHGSLPSIVEEVGRPQKNSRKWKVLYHPDIGFSSRLYADFDLSLKQIKLRQSSIDFLMHRPELYDHSRCEQETTNALQGLLELRRAERIHSLKELNAFPSSTGLLEIETQYGDFVTDAELSGGCLVDENKSAYSGAGRSTRTNSPVRSQHGSQVATSKTRPEKLLTVDDEESEGVESEREAPTRRARITMKAELDTKNHSFLERQRTRIEEGPPDMHRRNTEMIREISLENARTRPRHIRRMDHHLDDEEEIYIYSGQKLNCCEKQKRTLREEMLKNADKTMWTYSAAYNTGCFPLLEKEPELKDLLRNSGHAPKILWENSKVIPPKFYSTALEEPWMENAGSSETTMRAFKPHVKGAFEVGGLGNGRDVLPLRRNPPPLQETAERAGPSDGRVAVGGEDKSAKATFCQNKRFQVTVRPPADRPDIVDKFSTTILQDKPQQRGLCYEARRVPREIGEKWGRNAHNRNVECPPPSLGCFEEYMEPKSTCEHPEPFGRSCARVVAPALAASRTFCSSGKQQPWQVTAAITTKGGPHVRKHDAPLSARERAADPHFRAAPMSAR